MGVRVMIVDDHVLVRRGLELVLATEPDITVVASVGSGEEAIEAIRSAPCEVALLDVAMPGIGGITAARQLVSECAVVMLTSSEDPQLIRSAMDAGAVGYVTKDVSPERLVEIIRMATEGLIVMRADAHRSARAASTPVGSTPDKLLTDRECELLGAVSEGLTNQEVADRLCISEATVRAHLTHIFRKLGARHRTEAVAKARAAGFLG